MEARESATLLAARIEEATPSTIEASGDGAALEARKALDELDALIAASPAPSSETRDLEDISGDLRLLLDEPIAAELTTVKRRIRALDEKELVSAANAAVNAISTALSPPALSKPSPTEADDAVEELCAAAGGEFLAVGEATRLCETDLDQSRRFTELSELRAKAELEVTRYRMALAKTDDARKALTSEVESRENDYATAVGERVEGVKAVDAVDAVSAGARVTVAALPGIGADDAGATVPVGVGAIGWVILGVLAIYSYRRLERRAAAKALGPVEVKGDEADLERFRFFLLRNIPDPGAVPGATALQPVTELLAVTQVPAANVIGKIVSALVAALDQRRGYTVTFKSLSPPKNGEEKAAEAPEKPPAQTKTEKLDTAKAAETPEKSPPQTKTEEPEPAVAVRVSYARTEALIDQQVLRGTTKDVAIREAAYWAAAAVLERSDRLPRWAWWSTATAKSLAAFCSEADTGQPNGKLIEDAVKQAPVSGELCLMLSHFYALQEKHLEALEFALRASSIYGRFVGARYRLAVCASLLAADLGTNWWDRPDDQRERVLSALSRYENSGTKALRDELKTRGVDPEKPIMKLCQFALDELKQVAELLRVWTILTNALRRSERSYWLAFLRPNQDWMTGRVQFRRAIDAAQPAIRQRAGRLSVLIGKAEKEWQKDQRTFWHVAYNLACCDAIRYGRTGHSVDATSAIERLETALERPSSHQLTRSWVKKDPDLRSIREEDRFKRFLEDLWDKERANANKA